MGARRPTRQIVARCMDIYALVVGSVCKSVNQKGHEGTPSKPWK